MKRTIAVKVTYEVPEHLGDFYDDQVVAKLAEAITQANKVDEGQGILDAAVRAFIITEVAAIQAS